MRKTGIIATFRNKKRFFMTTLLKVKLRESHVPGRAGTICYQLTHARQVQTIVTDIHLPTEMRDGTAQRTLAGEQADTAAWRLRIDGDTALLGRIIRDFDATCLPYTACEVADRFRAAQRNGMILCFLRCQIARLLADNRLGTARNYTRALNSFSAFLGGDDLPFTAFTERLAEAYNAYLLRRGVVRNTVSFYMRILRSVYNKAVRQHLTEQNYPFRNVYTGIDRTRKRAVDEQLIGRLRRLDLSASAALAQARDLFIFSYCMRGMAFVDMVYLRKRDIRDGAVHYIRRKTGQQMIVHLEACMLEIIDRYRPAVRSLPYVFPVLTSEEPEKAYSQYQVALNYYNRLLKRLSALLGLETGLSSYTSRHSWATAARKHNVPLSVISAGMGHTSERTTEIYLSALETTVVDCANRQIIASMEGCVL